MVHREPVPDESVRYECRRCGYAATGGDHGPTCPECGGPIRLGPVAESGE